MGVNTYGGRYVEMEHPALRGGMGSVVLCKDPNLNRVVAIKFLHATGVEKKRIFDEVTALQQIRSKNVVDVYDIVVTGPANHIGIVQEYLPGTDLVGFHKSRPDPSKLLRVLYQLAAGLDDINSQGLIHRDVKPNNVKHDAEEILKIFDFGLSRTEDDQAAQTVGFRGTPGFAAPELYAAPPVRFTRAVDAYAYAATALYLAKGTLPGDFMCQPPRAEAWTVTRGFATLAIGIPAPLADLLDRCLATNPSSRPSMGVVRTCIEQHLVLNQHRALIVHNHRSTFCDRTQSRVTLNRDGVGTMVIAYDGLGFAVDAIEGDMYVNNVPVIVGLRIPTSCVITIGAPSLGSKREFVTMDISRPEIVL